MLDINHFSVLLSVGLLVCHNTNLEVCFVEATCAILIRLFLIDFGFKILRYFFVSGAAIQ